MRLQLPIRAAIFGSVPTFVWHTLFTSDPPQYSWKQFYLNIMHLISHTRGASRNEDSGRGWGPLASVCTYKQETGLRSWPCVSPVCVCVCVRVCLHLCVCGRGLTEGEGPGGCGLWWAGPNGIANDNLNLILPIGDEALELV